MTMSSRRQIPAGEFKARCLQLLDQVADGREELVVTKRGRPVARVVPIAKQARGIRGSVQIHGDLIAPLQAAWDAET
jgi:prevent-host-death family protein